MARRAVNGTPAGLAAPDHLAPLMADVVDTLGEVGLLSTYVSAEGAVLPDERERRKMQAVHLRATTRLLAAARAELDLLHLDLTGRPWEPV